MTAHRIAGSLALTVHGTRGAVDLVVPPNATAMDLAREYAAQLGLAHVPPLLTPLGEELVPEDVLTSRGLVSGDLLVVAEPVSVRAERRRRAAGRRLVRSPRLDGARFDHCVRSRGDGQRGQPDSQETGDAAAGTAGPHDAAPTDPTST